MPTTGTFSGKPPEGERRKLEIKVTARDKAGIRGHGQVQAGRQENGEPAGRRRPRTVRSNDGQKSTDAGRPADQQTAQAPLPGRPSLTAQVKAARTDGFMAEGLALLESLLKAAGIDDIDKAA